MGKLIQLGLVAGRRPREAWDRVRAFAEVRVHTPPPAEASVPESWGDFARRFDLVRWAEEPTCVEIEAHIRAELDRLQGSGAPQNLFGHGGDFSLGRACYALVRRLGARSIVETGVAIGVTTCFVLAALRENGGGKLHSIDLPPLGCERWTGAVVPAELRADWQLYRGTSARLLPDVARDAAPIDLFVHDSLHTDRTVRRELSQVTPRLARPSGIVADDVDDYRAFTDWLDSTRPAISAVVREEHKVGLFGVAILQ